MPTLGFWPRKLRKLRNRLNLLLHPSADPVTLLPVQPAGTPMQLVGSSYGGWYLPQGLLQAGSQVLLAGAGTDITFDVVLAQQLGCHVHIADPTPRAVAHYHELQEAVVSGTPFYPVPPAPDGKPYDLMADGAHRMQLHPVALWHTAGNLRFYVPSSPVYVSMSALNLHQTSEYIEVPAVRLGQLIKDQGLPGLDLLKLDIEGAEYAVLKTVAEDGLRIGIICIEYDEYELPSDSGYRQRIRASLEQLLGMGYQIIHADGKANYTLLLPDYWKGRGR